MHSDVIKVKRHHFYALCLSCVLLAAALSLLFMKQWFGEQLQQTVTVREAVLVSLPPPPPPPVSQQVEQVTPTLLLSISGDGPSIEMSIDKTTDPLLTLTPPMPMFHEQQDWQVDLSVDWQAFGLEQLDSLPQVMTGFKAPYPNALVRKGIHKVLVKLDVFIDEMGHVSLVEVINNDYPELDSAIKKLVKESRFSVPKKDDIAVKARFIWPVEFKKS